MFSGSETRREFLGKLGAVGAAVMLGEKGAGGQVVRRGGGGRPNVILILADDLGYGDLSCYGAKDLRTPHIDKLVGSGMKFESFYANCPVCSPTRAALLTGRVPDMVGVPGVIRTNWRDNFGYLDPQAVMLGDVLKGAGYTTGLVGKWHLGLEEPNVPNERGFDFFHGFLGDMMDDYYTHRRGGLNFMRLNEKEIDPEGHATDLFTEWAVDYVRGQTEAEKPFFLFLSYNAPHTPIQPPAEWVEKVKQREAGIDEKRAKLAALIEHLDEGIGKVMAALEETGKASDTLVIFTSDNGGQVGVGANNGALSGTKGTMLEGGIRVVTGAVWPGRIEAGAVNRDHVSLSMDLYATICEAAGAEYEHEIEGRSFLKVLLGEEQTEEERTLFWVRREGGNNNGRAFYAVRRGDWKLLQNSAFEEMRLYNLKDDPQEERPLPREHREYRRLFNALRDHIIRAGGVKWQKR